ncbi:MAG: hypothetical protein V1652_03740 [bacterium]
MKNQKKGVVTRFLEGLGHLIFIPLVIATFVEGSKVNPVIMTVENNQTMTAEAVVITDNGIDSVEQPIAVNDVDTGSTEQPKPKINGETVYRKVTMYTSTPEQTWGDPCIGAAGIDLCKLWEKGITTCASNVYPKGTTLSIERVGDCVVLDTLASKYAQRIDIYGGYDTECLKTQYKDGTIKKECSQLQKAFQFGSPVLAVTKNSSFNASETLAQIKKSLK